MNKNQMKTLAKFASVLRIPPEIAKPVVSQFCFWEGKSGPEWTISRFKSVKVDFIRLKAGQSIETPWVAKEGNSFKGVFKGLQNWALKSDKNFAEAIQLLQIYSALVAPEATQVQATKFVAAVQSNVKSDYFDHYCNIMLHARSVALPLEKRWYPNPRSLLFYPVSSTKREPHASGKSFAEGTNTLNCALSFIEGTTFGRDVVGMFPELFGSVLEGIACAAGSGHCEWEYPNVVGKIGLIQEPGFKLRAVANPGRVYQAALLPLGDAISGLLELCPWDCTYNQTFPTFEIQQRLKHGQTAHAVDLSNATDMFPFELQYRLLLTLFARTDGIDLFAALSRANWGTSLTPEGVIKWETGQPLGLRPSFPAFALTHGLMLFALNGFKHEGDFYVLGDDVIILNDDLNIAYKRFLNHMGLPYAASKTLSSNVITEFAGKLITKDKVIPQLKWRVVSDDSFIDLARFFGERFRIMMRQRQRDVFDIVKVLPEDVGGCGFNPTGIPLSQRYAFYYQVLETEAIQSYMLSYNGRISSMNYEPISGTRAILRSSQVPGTWFLAEPPVQAFDQNAISLAEAVIPLLRVPILDHKIDGRYGRHLSDNIIDSGFPWAAFGSLVRHVFPRNKDLQIQGEGPNSTTLQVLERKLEEYL